MPSFGGMARTPGACRRLGGAVAFGVHSLVFPPDPRVHVGRAANAAFSGLDGVDWPISCDALEPWYG